MIAFAFASPWALAALALVGLPVVAHMLRRARSRTLEFPSLRFLRETPSFARALTTPNRRWLLALRMLAVALLAIAIARPVFENALSAPQGVAVAILVDASASMSRDGARDAARSGVERALEALGATDRVRVAAFDTQLRWLGEWGTPEDAKRSLDRYAPGFAAADFPTASTAAATELGRTAERRRRMVVVSDFQVSNGPWTIGGDDASIAISPIRVGDAFGNAVVTGVDVVSNGTVGSVHCAEARDDSAQRAVSVVQFPLRDGAAAGDVHLERAGDGWLARTIAADAFDADDAFYFVAPKSSTVLVCDPGPSMTYLQAAVETSQPSATVVTSTSLTSAPDEATATVIASGRAIPDDRAAGLLADFVSRGGRAIVFTSEPRTWSLPQPTGDARDLDGVRRTSEAVGDGDLALDDALSGSPIRGARSIDAVAGDVVVLCGLDGSPVAVRRALGRGTATIISFDATPASAPIVRTGAFPALVSAIAFLSTRSGDAGQRMGVGGAIDSVTAHDGSAVAIEGGASFTPLVPGIYTVVRGGERSTIAVNVPASESSPAVLSADAVNAAIVREGAATTASSRSMLESLDAISGLWRWVLAVVLLLTLLELVIASGVVNTLRPER